MADNPIVCRCYRVTAQEILDAIRNRDLRTVEEVTAATNAAGGCSSCYDDVQALLDGAYFAAAQSVYQLRVISDEDKRILVMGVLRDLIVPLYGLNGVQIQVLDVKGSKVHARLTGRTVGTTLPSILALKWALVRAMTDACGEKMQLVEVNMLDRGIAEDPI